MFYNALIQAFLQDESLFTDVKAIVDCPLKADPSEVIRACREMKPRDILALLDTPGSDLEHLTWIIPQECQRGRGSFLNAFDRRDVEDSTKIEEEAIKNASRGQRGRHRRKSLAQQDTSEGLRNLLDPREFAPREAWLIAPNAGHKITMVEAEMIQMASRGGLTNPMIVTPKVPRAIVRRATASAMWTDRLAAIVGEYDDKSVATPSSPGVISDITKRTVLTKYFMRLKCLGESLILLWPKFYRRVSPHWAPDRNSLIPIPRPFVVPGGRFIEIYYWDSYWIIRGLLSSGLETAAQEMIENFLFCVERYGFIPNGLRKYYLDRSQPPLLSCMLRAYFNVTQDVEFIRGALQMLEREYAWWMSAKKGHAVEMEMPDKRRPGMVKKVTLNRYYSLEVTPRPESYRIDQITGTLYQEYKGAAASLEEHFRAIRAGAESGWDFSSRWLRPAVEGQGESGIKPDIQIDKVLHKVCLVDIDTCTILPCDLNAFLFCLEEDLAFFAAILGKTESELQYLEAREARREAMLYFLWDQEREMWLDYDMKTQALSCVISAASFAPLWAGLHPEHLSDERRIQLASRLSCLIRPYGVVSTNISAGLQWDHPNVWAPYHHMAVDFLCGGRFWETHKSAQTDRGPAMALGINWASRFVNTVLDRFEFFGTISEKYDCARLGKSGLDGEYVTQDGFGWTNGAVLDMLEKFTVRLSPAGLYSSRRPGNEALSQFQRGL